MNARTSQRTLTEAVSDLLGSSGLEMIFGIFRAAWENARRRDEKLAENAPLTAVPLPVADPRTMPSHRSRSSITEIEIALDWDPDAPTDAAP